MPVIAPTGACSNFRRATANSVSALESRVAHSLHAPGESSVVQGKPAYGLRIVLLAPGYPACSSADILNALVRMAASDQDRASPAPTFSQPFNTQRKQAMTIHSTLLGAAALVLALGTSSINAQTESRDQVKSETKAANAAGAIPRGESTNQQPKLDSVKTRADRKAETAAAQQRGDIARGGEAHPVDGKVKPTNDGRNRADVKAETKTAVKAGQITSGEKN